MTIRRIYTGDNLAVMQRLDDASVDLIYLDPPFNSNRDYAAPVTLRASEHEGQVAKFRDTWEYTDSDAEWLFVIEREEPAVHALIAAAMKGHSFRMGGYLCMMAARLLEMRRLMKPAASIYLHCDPTASHYLKTIMDAIFGRTQFRNEIVWGYNKWTNAAKAFQQSHDVILAYALTDGHTFNKEYRTTERKQFAVDRGWESNRVGKSGAKVRQLMVYDWEKANEQIATRPEGYYGRVMDMTDKPQGSALPDWWGDIPYLNSQAKERVGYPTQKPLELLERIIKASSNPGDVVLDPFAGCATACVAAERLDRQWIGIDVSDMAAKLVIERLQREYNAMNLPAYSELGATFHPDDVERIQISGRAKPVRYQDRRSELYQHQNGVCAGCGEALPERLLAVDHIKPRAKGGTDELANLQLLCSYCNSVKGSGTMADLKRALKARGII